MTDRDAAADYDAEMARDLENMTDEEWDEFEAAQEAASYVSACQRGERRLDFGYGG